MKIKNSKVETAQNYNEELVEDIPAERICWLLKLNLLLNHSKCLLLVLIVQFVFKSAAAQSGDEPFKPFSDDDLFDSSHTLLNEPDSVWKFEEENISSSSSSSTSISSSTVAPDVAHKGRNDVIQTDVASTSQDDLSNNEGGGDVDLATRSIILVMLVVVALFLIFCVWRIVQVRRQRSRRRKWRYQAALNAILNGEKPDARELLTMNGSRISDYDIDVEASEKGKEALLPAIFSTTVTVDQTDSLTGRLQPPPPKESIRSSADVPDGSAEQDTTLESLGRSVRISREEITTIASSATERCKLQKNPYAPECFSLPCNRLCKIKRSSNWSEFCEKVYDLEGTTYSRGSWSAPRCHCTAVLNELNRISRRITIQKFA